MRRCPLFAYHKAGTGPKGASLGTEEAYTGATGMSLGIVHGLISASLGTAVYTGYEFCPLTKFSSFICYLLNAINLVYIDFENFKHFKRNNL